MNEAERQIRSAFHQARRMLATSERALDAMSKRAQSAEIQRDDALARLKQAEDQLHRNQRLLNGVVAGIQYENVHSALIAKMVVASGLMEKLIDRIDEAECDGEPGIMATLRRIEASIK